MFYALLLLSANNKIYSNLISAAFRSDSLCVVYDSYFGLDFGVSNTTFIFYDALNFQIAERTPLCQGYILINDNCTLLSTFFKNAERYFNTHSRILIISNRIPACGDENWIRAVDMKGEISKINFSLTCLC